MNYVAALSKVTDRGRPPVSFVEELVEIAKGLPDEIFASRPAPKGKPDPDIFAVLRPILGPWKSFLHRKAALLELLRVLAGKESSWKWNEGVDITNQHSLSHIEGQETGIFQVSFDSVGHSPELADCVNRYCGGVTAELFIPMMKKNHTFAVEYCARLLRHSWQWDGPIRRGEVQADLSPAAVDEFMQALA